MKKVQLSYKDKSSIKTFLLLVYKVTIYNYYLFPFTGGNYRDFSLLNVKSLHINKDISLLYVSVKRVNMKENFIISTYKSFLYIVKIKGIDFMVFSLQKSFISDTTLILQGKCTEISDKAKTLICLNSGLKYNSKENGMYQSHILLQVLYKNNPARELLSYYFDTPLKDVPEELVPAVGDDSIIYIENWIGS
jgi:hypothetical protein